MYSLTGRRNLDLTERAARPTAAAGASCDLPYEEAKKALVGAAIEAAEKCAE